MNALDYDRRARMHRPTDSAVLALEIRRLRQNGLTARDISDALRIDMGAVLNALATPSPSASSPMTGSQSGRLSVSSVEGDSYTGLDLPTLRK